MDGNQDALYAVFEMQLQDDRLPEQSDEDFIETVTSNYFIELLGRGHIPEHVAGEVFMDIKSEVKEMLETKIYGHFCLKSYRKTQS